MTEDIDDHYGTMRLPAICASCGTVFPSDILVAGPGPFTTQNHVTRCPSCSGDGMVPNGAYAIVERVLAYSRNAESREDMVAAMRTLGDALGPGGVVDLEMLERRLPREAPTVSDWVLAVLRDPAWQGVGGIGAVVAILIAVFGFRL